MKAVAGTGEASALHLEDIAAPTPSETQLLVKIIATGVNRLDAIQRKGGLPPAPGHGPTLGLEFCGTVADLGAGVTGFVQGDRVFGLVSGEAYAEYVVIDHRMAWKAPEGLDDVTAACIPEAFLTAYRNIFHVGQFKEGENVLFHAGASGVGCAAIQLARLAGAGKIFVTAGSAEKGEFCKSLGADIAINYKTEEFDEVVNAKGGVDVIIDCIGGDYLPKDLECLKMHGRLVYIGLLSGPKSDINLALVLRKQLQIKGSLLRPQPLDYKIPLAQEFAARFMGDLCSGKIKVPISKVFPFSEAAQAHEFMEASANTGKIALKW